METFYDVLKVREDAPHEVIRATYKTLSSMYHPDKNPGDDSAAEMMKRINQAYATLRDPDSRTRYDEELRFFRGTAHQQQPEPPESEQDSPIQSEPQESPRHTPSRDAQRSWWDRFSNGDLPLWQVYWIYGAIVGFGFNILFKASGDSSFLAILYLIYFSAWCIATWRSAGKYKGPAVLAGLAKIPVVLGAIGVSISFVLAFKDGYQNHPTLNPSQISSSSTSPSPVRVAPEVQSRQQQDQLQAQMSLMDSYHPGWRQLVQSQRFQQWLMQQSAEVQTEFNQAETADRLGSIIVYYQQSTAGKNIAAATAATQRAPAAARESPEEREARERKRRIAENLSRHPDQNAYTASERAASDRLQACLERQGNGGMRKCLEQM